MIQLDLDAFTAPFSPAVQVKLRELAADPSIQCLVGKMVDGRLTALAFASTPDPWPAGTVSAFCKQPLHSKAESQPLMTQSKTMQALALVQEGLTPYAAAKQVGITRAAVYNAINRREDKTVCPCCKQLVREGFTVDQTVLKDQAPGSTGA